MFFSVLQVQFCLPTDWSEVNGGELWSPVLFQFLVMLKTESGCGDQRQGCGLGAPVLLWIGNVFSGLWVNWGRKGSEQQMSFYHAMVFNNHHKHIQAYFIVGFWWVSAGFLTVLCRRLHTHTAGNARVSSCRTTSKAECVKGNFHQVAIRLLTPLLSTEHRLHIGQEALSCSTGSGPKREKTTSRKLTLTRLLGAGIWCAHLKSRAYVKFMHSVEDSFPGS